MAGKDEPHTWNLADMQGTRANHVAYLKAGLYYWRGTLAPAISKHPRAFLYGWLPLSNAYGISSVENKSIIHFISEFFIKEE